MDKGATTNLRKAQMPDTSSPRGATAIGASTEIHRGDAVVTSYLDLACMKGIDTDTFRATDPFPWVNPQGFLTPKGYEHLLANMPNIEQFTPVFGTQRKFGQGNCDRYGLHYADGMDLPTPWQAFIDELKGDDYRSFVSRILGHGNFRFRFNWHYTPRGCAVFPHCDARGKIGTQIFYMNRDDEWESAWGGETVILDDDGRFSAQSSPGWEDFDREIAVKTQRNRSLIFARRSNSWHGVRPLRCPEHVHRKVFIVVFEDYRAGRFFVKRVRRLLKGKPMFSEDDLTVY